MIAIRERMKAIAHERPRFGYRRSYPFEAEGLDGESHKALPAVP
jgi:hypothetical protein